MEGKSRENEFCRTFQKRRGREPAMRKYGLRGGRNGRKPLKTADKRCQIYNTLLGIIIIDIYLFGIIRIIFGYHYKNVRYYKKMAGYYNNFGGWTR